MAYLGNYLMINRLPARIAGVLLIILAALPLALNAQGGDLPPIAAVTNGQLFIYGPGGQAQNVSGGGFQRFSSLTWSPNGQALAYAVANGGYTVHTANRGGGGGVQLATGASFMPLTFSADGSSVIYAVNGDIVQGDAGPLQTMTVLSQTASGGSQPESIGQFSFGVGCGGGSPFPMDGVYNTEAGFGGRGLTFARTDFGLLHSVSCAGTGLALLDLETSEDRLIDASLTNATLSPDGTRVAAIRQGGIVVINLADLSQQGLPNAALPDQLAWTDNNTIYYSVRHLLGEPLPLSEAEAQVYSNTFGVAPNTIPQYSVDLRRISLGGGDSLAYSGPGWAIGRIFASGGAVYFSVVPNGEAWVEALANGSIDFNASDGVLRERLTVAPRLFRLNGGAATELAADIGQARPNPAG